MNHVPLAYRHAMPGVFMQAPTGLNGFDGLAGIGSKLKKKAKKLTKPLKKVGQQIAAKDPLLGKVVAPAAKAVGNFVSTQAKKPVVQLVTAAVLPMTGATLIDKDSRRTTTPVYAAYGTAAVAAATGGAAAGALTGAGGLTDTAAALIANADTDGSIPGMPGVEEPAPLPEELPQDAPAAAPDANPLKPLAWVGGALSLLSFLR